jgi:hypothetical protein
LYSDAYHKWRGAILAQTWPNFKADFAEAHRNLRIILQTAAHGAGYQSANAATDELTADYRREATQALDHLPTATGANCTAVANLTKGNMSLSTQLGTANTSIASMKQLIETLQIQLRNLSPPSGSLNGNYNNSHKDNNNRNNDNNNSNNRNGNNNSRNNNHNTSYCHTMAAPAMTNTSAPTATRTSTDPFLAL